MNTKTHSFYNNTIIASPDIVLITETWLNDSVQNSELFTDVYNVIRRDRDFAAVGRSRGGGVLIAIAHTIPFEVIDTSHINTQIPLVDLVVCKIVLGHTSIYSALVYIPPDATVECFEILTSALEILFVGNLFILVGDFNLPDLILPPEQRSRKTRLFQNFLDITNAKQYNDVKNVDGNILDLLITNTEFNFQILHSPDSVLPEDAFHPSLEITIQSLHLSPTQSFPFADDSRYDFNKADYTLLYDHLFHYDWTFLTDFQDVNLALNTFYDTLYSILDRYVPRKRKSSSTYPPWFTSAIIFNLKNKNYNHKKWIQTRDIKFYNEFKRLRTLIKCQIKDNYISYLSRMENEISTSPSNLWNFLGAKRRTTRIPGRLHDGEGNEFADPNQIVNAFADNFSTVCNLTNCTHVELDQSCLPCRFQPITQEVLIKFMAALPNKPTAGFDQLPCFLIRDCRYVLAYPLQTIINLSIESSVFPDRWKITKIVPVHKRGDRTSLCNYRPISVISNLSKIYEKILYSTLYNSTRSFISPNQHGFMCGRSTVTNLAIIAQYLGEVLDRRGRVDVIYTDLSKAFDLIDHELLLNKLSSFGLAPSSLYLIRSYLHQRQCYVNYNGHLSRNFTLGSGVPQGSNLGPLLFVLFINDLLLKIDCPVLGYADDIKIFSEIACADDEVLLQRNLDTLHQWCDTNKLRLNIAKCCVVRYSRSVQVSTTSYYIDGVELELVSEFKDLGVLFDPCLSFKPHILHICSEAFKSLGFIMRVSKYFTSTAVLKTLYFAYVLSKIEYACLVWYPLYASDFVPLDRIHRKFLKYLSLKLDGVYPEVGVPQAELLLRHDMLPLNTRRDLICTKFLEKLLTNRIDCPFLLERLSFLVPRSNARYDYTFRTPFARTNLMMRAPSYILSRLGNRVPDNVFD